LSLTGKKEEAMSRERVTMRKIREILRLKLELGMTNREVARSCKTSASVVSGYVGRFKVSGLPWPLPPEMDEEALERRLFPGAPEGRGEVEPDWAQVHQEIRRRDAHVTLQVLWEEYRQAHPDGFGYSWFCERYQQYGRQVEPVMRQVHRFGEKGFVDYAGDTVGVVDPGTGEVRQAQVFVGVLGASNYTYAQGCWRQDIPSWLSAHVGMLSYFGGSPRILVPDNLKSGVQRPDYYEPGITPAYQELATYYGCAVVPARVRKPRDKAKVESAVLQVERQILARLRGRTFLGLGEFNRALWELLEEFNQRPFAKLPGCRRSWWEEHERPALLALPEHPYEVADWKRTRVGVEYHVEVDGHYYSVPYALLGEPVEVRVTPATVEVFHRGGRVASHRRSPQKGKATTLLEHMPSAHRAVAQWTAERIHTWALKVGPQTARMAAALMAARQVPELGLRSCLGLLRLSRHYQDQRLEAACQRALAVGAVSYQSVASILQKGLDRMALPGHEPVLLAPRLHENVRGAGYYQ
jgi:transposase